MDPTSRPDRRLKSWKQIARYLDRNVRTVMRWEKECGMPVHRVPGDTKGRSVFAFADELDSWLGAGGPEGTQGGETSVAGVFSRQGMRWVTVGALAVLAAWWALTRLGPQEPASVAVLEVSGSHVVGRDPQGVGVWTFTHPDDREFDETEQVQQRLELEDGSELLLFGANTRRGNGAPEHRGELLAFGDAGDLRWRVVREDSLQFGGVVFGAPWISAALSAYRMGDRALIVWAVHHFTWWPAELLVLDGGGRVTGSFVNSGWIVTTNLEAGDRGDRLLVGGVSNSKSAAFMAVLDPEQASSVSPEEPGSPYECVDCADGSPLAYLIFPRSDVNEAGGQPYNETTDIRVERGEVTVSVREGPLGSDIAWVYTFTPDLGSFRMTPSDSYWPAHRVLELEGRLDHSADACPQRTPPPVRVWLPSRGWEVLEADPGRP